MGNLYKKNEREIPQKEQVSLYNFSRDNAYSADDIHTLIQQSDVLHKVKNPIIDSQDKGKGSNQTIP